MSFLSIRTDPLDKENMDTVIKRNTIIDKININLIFWYLIFNPHLLVDNYYS